MAICGADCSKCGYGKNKGCKGCESSGGCPFGKQCFIAKYIKTGGMESFNAFKAQLMDEFNALNIEGMPEITELYPLNGSYVNLAYPLPGGSTVKFLDDNELYLGTQVECEFGQGEAERCYGLVAGIDFILVSEYGVCCAEPQIVLFKKR